jgi:hypothetical protein
MPFDPEHPESESSISAGEDAVETASEVDFSVGAEGEQEEAAQAHTIKGGTVG